MLSYQIFNPCQECHSASYLSRQIEDALTAYGLRMWRNRAFLLGRSLDWERVKRLLYYKDIVKNLMFDPFYYGPDYGYEDIESKVKALTNALR